MRLISKTILYLLAISIPILIVAGVFAYFSIYDAVEENTREVLLADKARAEKIISSRPITGRLYLSYDSLSYVEPEADNKFGYTFGQAVNMFAKEEEQYQYNTLSAYYKSGNQNYKIIIWRPAIEEDDLIESLIAMILIVIVTMMLVFFIASIFISKYTWKPFYATLAHLKRFRLNENSPIPITESGTKEFKDLNDTVAALSEKMIKDFQLQKEFTENASHEMQTPLAVIKAKLESLMQSPQLNEKDLHELEGAERAVNKLISLNKSLLLLAKIENHQFSETEGIDVNKVVQRILNDFEDYISQKQITVQLLSDEPIVILANNTLMEILFSNFIQNAIRHNVSGGLIKIEMKQGFMKISNTGSNGPLSKEQLFTRFKHSGTSLDSTGLGLAIVQSICELYNFKLEYRHENNLNSFEVKFPS